MSSMLEDKTKEHNELYRCLLRQNKTRDMTDRIGVVYAQRQNEIMGRIVCVLSMLKQDKDMTKGRKKLRSRQGLGLKKWGKKKEKSELWTQK